MTSNQPIDRERLYTDPEYDSLLEAITEKNLDAENRFMEQAKSGKIIRII